MTDTHAVPSEEDGRTTPETAPADAEPAAVPRFILYLEGEELRHVTALLSRWVNHLLVPVYVKGHSSSSPWCSRWWLHDDAVAHLYGLWMAWLEMTDPGQGLCGPANWHRDYLAPLMGFLRDPSGPFAGCRPGTHRAQERPPIEDYPIS
ncbi:DUF4913 domain-containing protein [Streptomyces sp. V4-01]|uniref:DUF4913 domain-containing protein n=1 Tax=Actinacidiphila polyblastidii TaxID=3110430 RepID=A0ABU7PFA6_9ACTN|nr:DUF4913 domain-containing protein [Streptomyces sp. V4-01]